jgi:RNA polymerase primary sigma factor
MQIAFKTEQVKTGGRGARVRSPKKCLPKGWRAKRLPALANEEPSVTVKPDETASNSEPIVALPPEPVSRESMSGDTLQLYLREIGQVKLLTPEEELALAKKVKRGDKKARERMITANLRLVVRIARDYEGLGLPLLDLINEGNIGLMKGVERYDHKKGAKLSYYAAWWIKQSMMRALANQSKTIRLPVHVVDKMAHIRRAEVKLREAFGHEPTDQEIAEHLELDPRRIQEYRDASRTPVSLDAPLGHDEPKPIAEVVADTNAAAPFERLVQENDRGLVKEALAVLDDRESRILRLRFGLDNGQPKTLEEIAVVFGVTRERIRQIQDGALKKMRVQIEESETPVLDPELVEL